MTRRALLAAIRLVDLTGDGQLAALVDELGQRLPVESWIRSRAASMASWRADPLLAELTRAEREVLAL